MLIFFNKKTEKKEYISMEKPKDYAFMEQSDKVLKNLPMTWRTYPKNIDGAKGIIDMEYNEMKKAKTDEEISKELVHLASACLYLWRMMNVK